MLRPTDAMLVDLARQHQAFELGAQADIVHVPSRQRVR